MASAHGIGRQNRHGQGPIRSGAGGNRQPADRGQTGISINDRTKKRRRRRSGSPPIECGTNWAVFVVGCASDDCADGFAASGVRVAPHSPWRAGNTPDASDCADRQHRCLGQKCEPFRRHGGNGHQQFNNILVCLRNAAAVALPMKTADYGRSFFRSPASTAAPRAPVNCGCGATRTGHDRTSSNARAIPGCKATPPVK
jgi:hypothetical protein